jgi:hypothetical protein
MSWPTASSVEAAPPAGIAIHEVFEQACRGSGAMSAHAPIVFTCCPTRSSSPAGGEIWLRSLTASGGQYLSVKTLAPALPDEIDRASFGQGSN